jgi:hyperosmotically inducible protein
MNSQTSRYIIVAGGMAAVVGIAIVAFALRSHPASVARAPLSPTPAAQIPDPVSAPVAEIPDVPGMLGQVDVGGTQSTQTVAPIVVEPKLAPNRHPSKAGTSTVATNGTDKRNATAVDTGVKPAGETVVNSVGRVKSADDSTTTPTDGRLPADEQKTGAGTQLAASDNQITTDVKSQIAGDSLSKDANIGVTTSHGVVALTGSLPSQEAVDHVKDVAGRVQDVKSVDTSALLVASL